MILRTRGKCGFTNSLYPTGAREKPCPRHKCPKSGNERDKTAEPTQGIHFLSFSISPNKSPAGPKGWKRKERAPKTPFPTWLRLEKAPTASRRERLNLGN